MNRLAVASLAALLPVFPVNAQATVDLPGDPVQWARSQTDKAAPLAPDLSKIEDEAVWRASWSTTVEPCAAPPQSMRLYGLQPAHADKLVAESILAGTVEGGWTFYAETGCPQTPVLRFLYLAETDGQHLLLVVNRGEVISTPSMMRETSAIAGADAFEAAQARVPACDISTVGMRQTRIIDADPSLGPPVAGTRFAGGWTEGWRFTACGLPVDVTVRFDTDGKGGSTARIQNVSVGGGG